METKRVCVKVKHLRKLGCDNFREWLQDDNNVYVGRHGRVWVDKEIFENLRGKNLGCWCEPGDKCHVDVLIELLSRD